MAARKKTAGDSTYRPSAEEFHALRHALEITEGNLGLVLGVLAALWPSSLVPIPGGTHARVVLDTPAGEIAFTLPRSALARMWHVPELVERPHDEEAVRMRDERLVQLATGITPMGPRPSPLNSVSMTDRRSGRDQRGD